jgi:predicted GIY-YIG superfamily endonuclease
MEIKFNTTKTITELHSDLNPINPLDFESPLEYIKALQLYYFKDDLVHWHKLNIPSTYALINQNDDMFYFGSTNTPFKRIYEHLMQAAPTTRDWMRCYNWKEWNVIIYTNKSIWDAKNLENELIAEYNAIEFGFNRQ